MKIGRVNVCFNILAGSQELTKVGWSKRFSAQVGGGKSSVPANILSRLVLNGAKEVPTALSVSSAANLIK